MPRQLPCLVLTLACLTVSVAFAQPHTMLAPPKDGTLDKLIQVPAGKPHAMAISETHGLLAIAHDKAFPHEQVSLVKLDAKGNPSPTLISWKLTGKHEAFAKVPNYALAVSFHPKHPLLYVWHELGQYLTNPVPPGTPPQWVQFDHLLIYNVAKEPPELVTSLCRGDEFLFGMSGAALSVDPVGEYLYIPNLRDPKNVGSLRFARFKLDADGLPYLGEKDSKLPFPDRVKKIAELNAGKGVPVDAITPLDYVNLFPFSHHGSIQSIVHPTRDCVVVGFGSGLMSWRPEDKFVPLHGLPLKHRSNTLVSAHPRVPIVYATTGNTDSFFSVDASEGYLSSLPRQYSIPDAKLYGPPVTFADGKRLLIGGYHHVFQVSLDERGTPQPEVIRMQVVNPQVRAMLYSPKFDRAYVGVEVSK